MRFALALLVTLLPLRLSAAAAEKIRVSSFSTVLTELAQEIGGDRVDVTAHVKPGVDPHEFEPRPADLETVSKADLVLLSARHMEGYIGKLRQSAGGKARVVEVGAGLGLLKSKDAHGHGHGHKHDHGKGESAEDPHWWHSISHVRRAAKVVRDELTALSPADEKAFAGRADAYSARLDALAKWAKSEVAKLPRNRRKLVTSHDAFQYFAREHGFAIHAIEGLSSADQPSSKNVAEIIRIIKTQGVKAIFAEQIENPKVLQEITRETGAVLGGELYADGLGEGEAATYEGMYRHNVRTIVEALK